MSHLALVRRPTVFTAISLVLLALTGFSIGVSGQYSALITRSVPRTPGPSGISVVAPNTLASIGGVLSQVNRLIDGSDNPFSVRIEIAADRPYTGYVNVHRSGSPAPYRYPIMYSDLVPMVLFVDSGGTSLYTLWDRDGKRILPRNFERDAGFVSHYLKGLVALEFQGTRYSDAVYAMDICQDCVEPADDDLNAVVTKINAEIGGTEGDAVGSNVVDNINNTYLNTDLYLPFRVVMNRNLLSVDGSIARLRPRVDRDRVVIAEAKQAVTADRYLLNEVVSNDVLQITPFALLRPEFWAKVQEIFERKLPSAFLGDVHFLFETLALLRSAKESSPEDWEGFRQALASEVLVSANPEPWHRYSRSFCSLYSDAEDCQS